MLARYKRSRRNACYDSDSLVTHDKAKAEPRLHGPFPSCGDCAYPSHGLYVLQFRRRLPKNLYAKNESKEEDERVKKEIGFIKLYERNVIC